MLPRGGKIQHFSATGRKKKGFGVVFAKAPMLILSVLDYCGREFPIRAPATVYLDLRPLGAGLPSRTGSLKPK